MLPQRRQNSSCDPCRRSKRRCFFSSPRIGDTDVSCTHCKRLGHACTFEFVDSQSQNKRSRRARTRQSTSDSAAEAYPGLASGDFQADAVAGHDVLTSWLDFDYLEQNNEYLELPDFLAPDAVTSVEASKEDRLRVRPNLQHIVGSSLNSPIRLLNSKLDATILDIRLARIHDTIVTGCASRFADYDCNLYATASRYRLGDGDSEHHLLSSNASPQSQALISQTDGSLLDFGLAFRDAGCMMTILGTVRFLDHFSDIYGNRLTSVARGRSDAALKAVLRVFSLQWLSSTELTSTSVDSLITNSSNENQTTCDPLENAFHDAWSQARTLLRNAQSVRSFRVVYATLLFDGIAIPTKAHGATEPIVAHEFLDTGLQKLVSLDTLVKQYCVTLGSHSVYGALLEASLSVVRWGGYIRDIGAALTTDHDCKLPGISSHAKDQVESYDLFQFDNRNFHPDLNNSVPSICQKAVAEAFCVWRQIVEVKGSVSRHVQSHSRIPLELSETIASTMTAVGKFNQSFCPFMSTCIDNLERLSIQSRTSAVSITLYWGLSVLILAESLRDHNFLTEADIASTMRAHQEEAVSSVARTVERVLLLPTEEPFNLENGLSAEVPILAYHITPSLTATTFQKAIENIVSLYSCEEDAQHGADSIWKQQIDIVMKGLCSLDVTVGGSQVASAAIQSLMQQHGDILSECWTSDFST